MAQYFNIGIITEMVVAKDKPFSKVTLQNVLEQLNNEVRMSCYNHSEKDDRHCWKIKPALLEKNLGDFLETQFRLYKDDIDKDQHMQKVLQQIKKAKTAEQILGLAEEGFIFFQNQKHMSSIKVLRKDSTYFPEHITVYFTIASYLLDGKILMECYKNMFHYLEQHILLQRDRYPIVDCVKVMII